jgi:hypothetical protein
MVTNALTLMEGAEIHILMCVDELSPSWRTDFHPFFFCLVLVGLIRLLCQAWRVGGRGGQATRKTPKGMKRGRQV